MPVNRGRAEPWLSLADSESLSQGRSAAAAGATVSPSLDSTCKERRSQAESGALRLRLPESASQYKLRSAPFAGTDSMIIIGASSTRDRQLELEAAGA
jgi:hypothetical protein